MNDIERIARKLSDKWFVFVDFRYTYHWEVVADALLSVEAGGTMAECLMLARKLEFASYGELVIFFGHVEYLLQEQNNGKN